MRDNASIMLVGDAAWLRPYRARHVPAYHAWLSDAALQEATASEPQTLFETEASRRAWAADADKLTFLVCEAGPAGAPVGDVNVVLLDAAQHAGYLAAAGGDEASPAAALAEVSVMIAEVSARRRGLAGAAVAAALRFAMERRGVRVAVAKVGEANAPSLALFAKLGFVEARRLPFFGEVHLVAGPAQGLRERVYAMTAAAGYAEADDLPLSEDEEEQEQPAGAGGRRAEEGGQAVVR